MAHFVFYSVLGYCIAIALLRHKNSRVNVAVAVIIGVAFGVSDEVHQMFVPGRYPTVSDVVADTFGVAFGLYFFLRVPQIFRVLDRRLFT